MNQVMTHPTPDIAHPFRDVALWQSLLDTNSQVFQSLAPGASVGLLRNQCLPVPISQQLSGEMVRLTATETGMRASLCTLTRLGDIPMDILFVLSQPVLMRFFAQSGNDPFQTLSGSTENGELVVFYLKSGDDLEDLGYEDMFEAIGLSFAGACR